MNLSLNLSAPTQTLIAVGVSAIDVPLERLRHGLDVAKAIALGAESEAALYALVDSDLAPFLTTTCFINSQAYRQSRLKTTKYLPTQNLSP